MSEATIPALTAFHRAHGTGRSYWGPGDLYTFLVTGEESGGRYFSMLAPDELGGRASAFVGSFRFEHDQSWTRLEEVPARDRRRAEIQAFASGRLLPDGPVA